MQKPQKAHTTKKFFSRETSVSIVINATPEKIWEILATVGNYKNWNSTIVSIEGEIQPGGVIKIVPAISPNRTFTLKIQAFEPYTKMVSGDAMGRRTFLLEKVPDGTLFTMTEKIGGPLYPLFAMMIPSFDESFDTYARELKVEAEK
ncbi:MAG: SRPBCC domain-containing protein [Candidatus Pacebacteria bacterium]|nr:SRPBCC domain-containing protein [Candidatus Paceibacterota bacterium]